MAIDLNDVSLFVRVVEQGGFAKAAREARVPTSTVSRAVSRLEEALGARLVQRTSRSVQATDEGRALYAQAAPALATVQNAAREIEATGAAPHGRLRVSASGDVGTLLLPPILAAFADRCPHVQVEVDVTARKVNLVEEGIDVAIRAGPLADSSLVARKLADSDSALYASAAYVQARGMPASIEALAEHRCVLFRPKDGESEWVLADEAGQEARVRVRGRLAGHDYAFVRAAVAAGGGIALLPQILAAARASPEPLVRVLPHYVQRGAALFVVHPSARNLPAKVAAFRDFVVEAFARLYSAPPALPAMSAITRDSRTSRR